LNLASLGTRMLEQYCDSITPLRRTRSRVNCSSGQSAMGADGGAAGGVGGGGVGGGGVGGMGGVGGVGGGVGGGGAGGGVEGAGQPITGSVGAAPQRY